MAFYRDLVKVVEADNQYKAHTHAILYAEQVKTVSYLLYLFKSHEMLRLEINL